MNSFLRLCWLSSCLTTVILFGIAALAWKGRAAKLPSPPNALPGAATYVSEYGNLGTIDHYLYRFGLFGIGAHLRNSDVVLFGSSHVKYGISAAQLSKSLSDLRKQPVSVYNAGIGFSDGNGFARAILKGNAVEHPIVVLDLFSIYGSGVSPAAGPAMRGNKLGAYLHVLDYWLKVSCDYLLDPLLPQIQPLGRDRLKLRRFLGSIETRRWDTGDVVELWEPNQGNVLLNPKAKDDKSNAQIPYDDAPNRGIWFDATSLEAFSGADLLPIFTIVPFEESEKAVLPPEAKPFVSISSDDLFYWDKGMHLTLSSKETSTARLFSGLVSSHLLDKRLGEPSR